MANRTRRPNTGRLYAHDLAKAYLWLSAAARYAKKPKDKKRVGELLEKVHRIMPASWKPELDAKVDAHFSTAKNCAKSQQMPDQRPRAP